VEWGRRLLFRSRASEGAKAAHELVFGALVKAVAELRHEPSNQARA
jgi:hypothetical protein